MKMLDPKAIRKVTEQAQKAIVADENKKALLKRNEALKIKRLKKLYGNQMRTVLDAALNGKRQIEVDSIIYLRRLLEKNIAVFEIPYKNIINRKLSASEKNIDAEFNKELYKLFIDFENSAGYDLAKFFGSAKNFKNDGFLMLQKAAESIRIRYIYKDLEIFENPFNISLDHYTGVNFDKALVTKHSCLAKNINDKIYARGIAIEKFNEASPDNPFDWNQEIEDVDYEFDYKDADENDIQIFPTSSKHALIINWDSEDEIILLDQCLFSKDGLLWLTSEKGEGFKQTLFNHIKKDAKKGFGESILKLKFINLMWIIDLDDQVHCFNPINTIKFLLAMDFKAVLIKATKNAAEIKISW